MLTIASIHPDSIAADVTVVFQQKTKRKCQLLQYNADSEAWYCLVTVPVNAGLVASTGAEPSGIGIYTAQQGLPRSVSLDFTFFDPSMPQLMWQYPDKGPTSNALVVISFNNYCEGHLVSQYTAVFSAESQSRSGNVVHSSYDSCVTTLALLAPSLDSAFDSTVTVTPNGNTQKAFSFSFSFVEQLNVEASLTKAIVDSQPEMTLTVSNLVAVSNGELCQGASCAVDHNLVIRFGQVGIELCVVARTVLVVVCNSARVLQHIVTPWCTYSKQMHECCYLQMSERPSTAASLSRLPTHVCVCRRQPYCCKDRSGVLKGNATSKCNPRQHWYL